MNSEFYMELAIRDYVNVNKIHIELFTSLKRVLND